jgi:hypothetical protein
VYFAPRLVAGIATGLTLLVGGCVPGRPIEGDLGSSADYVALRLTPGSIAVPVNGTVDFQATVLLGDGSENPASGATFEATGGTIDGIGHYIAGPSPGFYLVIASLGGRADTSGVQITAPARSLTSLRVDPSTVALLPSATQQFSATGVLSDGADTSIAVTWSSTAGTVNGNGLFTAPAQAGTYAVVAAQQGGGLRDTARVTVSAVPPNLTAVVLTPAAVSLQFVQSQQFAAVGLLSDGSTTSLAVTWSATGGTINSSGRYTAGNTAGTFRVMARAANGMADTSSVSVTAPTITAITLTPATVALQSGQTQQFSVSATLSNGGTQANPSVTWSATGGSITTVGRYTAGSTTGTFRVLATTAGGPADTSSVTISTPTITAISVTPATVSVPIGRSQQFTATAILSNGGTQSNPSVTWTATGGTITTAGLYTAGPTAGNFLVSAASSSGRADTSGVTVPSTSSGWLANKPANYVTFSELDFSQPVPAGNPNVSYIGSTGWGIPFGDVGNFTQESDPSAPASGPNVWKLTIPAGTYGGGVIGQGVGTPFGDFYYDIASSARGSGAFKQDLYVAISVKWGFDDGGLPYEWHPVSNKWFELDSPLLRQMLIQSRDQLSNYVNPYMGYAPSGPWLGNQDPGRVINRELTSGVWHELEFIVNRGNNNTGRIRCWVDGELWGDYQNRDGLPLEANGGYHEFYFRNFRGGGGEIKLRNSYIHYDHILLASPQQ